LIASSDESIWTYRKRDNAFACVAEPERFVFTEDADFLEKWITDQLKKTIRHERNRRKTIQSRADGRDEEHWVLAGKNRICSFAMVVRNIPSCHTTQYISIENNMAFGVFIET